jgi:hypothetical protein
MEYRKSKLAQPPKIIREWSKRVDGDATYFLTEKELSFDDGHIWCGFFIEKQQGKRWKSLSLRDINEVKSVKALLTEGLLNYENGESTAPTPEVNDSAGKDASF